MSTFAISLIDQEQFHHLRQYDSSELINLWTPTPWGLRGLEEGDLILFMLKHPIRKIACFGTFKMYLDMHASDAWNNFKERNGVGSADELIQKSNHYANLHSKRERNLNDPVIGCILLKGMKFLNEADYFEPEEYGLDFSTKIVKIKYFRNVDLPQVIKDYKN